MKPRMMVVSVNFGDLLGVTLPYNREHFSEVMVVTTPEDEETLRVCWENDAQPFATWAFYGGKLSADLGRAKFAKWLAMEKALDFFGRHGLLCFMDADILWPKQLPEVKWKQGHLYSFARRRLLLDTTADIPPESEWEKLPLDPQYGEVLGYTQVFHASDQVLGKPPWFPTGILHAALGDCHFQNKWDLAQKIWLPYDLLHIGQYATNWLGRVNTRRDGTTPEGAGELAKQVKALKDSIWQPGRADLNME